MARKIQVKRGLKADLPILDDGELGLTTDTNELYIGSNSGNVQLADKVFVDNGLATKRDKTTKIDTVDLTDTLLQQMAGTTPINAVPPNFGVTADKIAPSNVNPSKLTFSPVVGTPSRNIFDKQYVTIGKYVKYQDGTLADSASYSVSDFIKIKPSTTYIANLYEQLAFYDASLNYLSGLGQNTYTTFTTPANAVYLRVSVLNTKLDILQIEEGTTLGDYVSAKPTVDELTLDSKVRTKINIPDYIRRLLQSLENPFIKTKIKILGDSITAGVGGTGYSATGEDIGTTGFKTNVLTATSWANMLYNLIISKYNKEHYISPTNPNIKITKEKGIATYPVIENFNLCSLHWRTRLYNTSTTRQGLSLTFYGDHFKVLYMKKSNTGIFEVLVDGVSYGTVDTYKGDGTTYGNEYLVSGLSLGNHKIEVIETNTKNASSTAKDVYIEGFVIPKTVIVKNFAISGKDSEYYYVNKDQVITSEDDIVIMQLGTNDRKFKSPEVLKAYQREIVKYAQGLGCQVILMCSIPAALSSENDPTRIFKMNDVNTAIRQLSEELGMHFISNYDGFLKYIDMKNITLDSLLSDGLHPNDAGYKVMFEHIAGNLGLSLYIDGIIYS